MYDSILKTQIWLSYIFYAFTYKKINDVRIYPPWNRSTFSAKMVVTNNNSGVNQDSNIRWTILYI